LSRGKLCSYCDEKSALRTFRAAEIPTVSSSRGVQQLHVQTTSTWNLKTCDYISSSVLHAPRRALPMWKKPAKTAVIVEISVLDDMVKRSFS
jgi:hypothetical protein